MALVLLTLYAFVVRPAYAEPPADTPPAAPTRIAATVPFTPLAGHGGPLVETRIGDGKQSVRLLLDTGAARSFLTRAAARRLGLEPRPAPFRGLDASRPDGGGPLEQVTVSVVRIGGWEARGDTTFLLLDDGALPDGDGPGGFDGLLGNDLLAKTGALLIDFPRRTLTLYAPGGPTDADRRAVGMEGAARVALTPESDGGLFRATLTLAGRAADLRATERVYVDTGAPGTRISRAAADALGLVAEGRVASPTLNGRPARANLSRVPSLTFGTLTVTDLPVRYPDRDGRAGDPPPLVGLDILGHCVALWDFAARTLYLKPVAPPPSPAPQGTSVPASTAAPDATRAP